MRKIVADSRIPYLRGVLEPWFDVVYAEGTAIGPEPVRDASALLVRTRTRCDAALLTGSAVEFIGTATIGFDHIDTAWCRAQGIEYATAAGCNARGVMQYMAAALTKLARRRGWRPAEKTLGLVGVGNVGTLVARLGRECGFRVVCCDPPKMRENPVLGYLPLSDLLEKADIVTLHVPLNREGADKTLRMADETFFRRMKPGAVFMNASRGEVVDETALKDALREGRVSDAVIDVWNGEPRIDRELLRLATFATPHIAGYSRQGKANGTSMVVRALARHFGLPLTDWYPSEAPRQVTDAPLSWEFVNRTIDGYYDIAADDARLRANPDAFESLRNDYAYRTEYF